MSIKFNETASAAAINVAAANRPTNRRSRRDLAAAIMLRPKDIYFLYGMPVSTLCELCQHEDPDIRIPSMLTPGRKGHKGSRYIEKVQFELWLSKWKTATVGSMERSAA